MKQRLAAIRARIAAAAARCDRSPEEVRLVAVSKTKPVELIQQALDAGVTTLGENYVQEARDKHARLHAGHPSVRWHFIGHLQRNKAKHAVRVCDLIQTVDSIRLAREIDKQAATIGKRQEILVQVNIGAEESKSGIDPAETHRLLTQIGSLENIRLTGLMIIPPFFDQPDRVRPFFRALRNLRDRLQPDLPAHVHLKELSMGMTGDFEAAIEEGATMVRIGTAIFGARNDPATQ